MLQRSKIISLNWPDNFWKTSQMQLLQSEMGSIVVETIWSSHSRFNKDRWKLQGFDERFWSKNTDFFLDTLITSIIQRDQRINSQKNDFDLIVIDRSVKAFVATIIATLCIKISNISDTDHDYQIKYARDFLYNWISKQGYDLTSPYKENISLLLNSSTSKDEQINLTMSRSSNWWSPSERLQYKEYQKLLNICLEQEFLNVKNCEKINILQPIIDVQNEIRAMLQTSLQLNIPLLFKNLEKIIWIWWMSESGKSTVGELLEQQWRYRLKIKYFESLINWNYNYKKPLNDEEFATVLLLEINKYVLSHKYATHLSLESIRNPKVFSHIKLLLGDRFEMRYLTASEQNVIQRTMKELWTIKEEVTALVKEKNLEKNSLWAPLIEWIADKIINNNDSLRDLENRVNEALNGPLLLNKLVAPKEIKHIIKNTAEKLVYLYGNSIKFIWVWGSVWRNDFQIWISDVDFIIVCSNQSDEKKIESYIRNVLWENSSVKLGVTLLPENCNEYSDPKYMYLSNAYRTWQLHSIYNKGYTFPLISTTNQTKIRQSNNADYFISTRNELLQNSSIGIKNYKHVFTCMKLYLAWLWYQVEWYKNLYDAFSDKTNILLTEYNIIPMSEILSDSKQLDNIRPRIITFLDRLIQLSNNSNVK
jgi:dephospho-CoA kinase